MFFQKFFRLPPTVTAVEDRQQGIGGHMLRQIESFEEALPFLSAPWPSGQPGGKEIGFGQRRAALSFRSILLQKDLPSFPALRLRRSLP